MIFYLKLLASQARSLQFFARLSLQSNLIKESGTRTPCHRYCSHPLQPEGNNSHRVPLHVLYSKALPTA